MAKVKIEWGTIKFKGDAEKVSKEISSIGEEVRPEEIVKYAESNADSELHKCFTWDNDEAAKKWRLQEARVIVCNLVVREVDGEAKEPTVIRWAMRTETTGGYRQVARIIKNQDEFSRLMNMAKAELDSFTRKYNSLRDTELNKVFAAIEAV